MLGEEPIEALAAIFFPDRQGLAGLGHQARLDGPRDSAQNAFAPIRWRILRVRFAAMQPTRFRLERFPGLVCLAFTMRSRHSFYDPILACATLALCARITLVLVASSSSATPLPASSPKLASQNEGSATSEMKW